MQHILSIATIKVTIKIIGIRVIR